jgi:DtxR family Mn-dependent transcriptional regulator
MPTEKVDEYLEAIFKLGCQEQGISLTQVAEYLRVTPASVTEMIKRMEAQGLVKYGGPGKGKGQGRGKKRGIMLTPRGERIAKTLIRRHRLSERFLTDVLGIDWESAHHEACKLEHVISPEVEERLAEVLGNPATCPHGHPIPDDKGRIAAQNIKPLSECAVNERGEIARVEEEEPHMLHYLATLGLLPDVDVEVKEIAPFNGPLLVKVGGAQYALGREVASKIWMRRRGRRP